MARVVVAEARKAATLLNSPPLRLRPCHPSRELLDLLPPHLQELLLKRDLKLRAVRHLEGRTTPAPTIKSVALPPTVRRILTPETEALLLVPVVMRRLLVDKPALLVARTVGPLLLVLQEEKVRTDVEPPDRLAAAPKERHLATLALPTQLAPLRIEVIVVRQQLLDRRLVLLLLRKPIINPLPRLPPPNKCNMLLY